MPDEGRSQSTGALARGLDRVRASWQRSREYGVPREGVQPVFSTARDDESLFYRCGVRALSDLSGTLRDEPVSLILTDADGLVLHRDSGDRALLRALDDVRLAPGFSYAEREAGTNGLGLALADRVPTLVSEQEHYALSLEQYTCAAVPVLDPLTGVLAGAVNLTVRSAYPGAVLLALAQSAAATTSALMVAGSRGAVVGQRPRGGLVRVEHEPAAGTLRELSSAWRDARDAAQRAVAAGSTVLAVGEQGSGRATLLSQALRAAYPRHRILCATTPAAEDVEHWLGQWSPECAKPDTAVVVRHAERLPAWAARALAAAADGSLLLGLTAPGFEDLDPALARSVEAVVHVAPLRERPDDVLPLARHLARRLRGRDVDLTPSAVRAMGNAAWPGNVEQLERAMRLAASRSDVIDVHHLPPEVLCDARRRLSRVEAAERDEIARVLLRPGTSVQQAARELGLSRATLYRRLAQYGLRPERG